MFKQKHKHVVILTLLLSLLALLGNANPLPLFYGIDFIFGSIAVMYAAMAFGRLSSLVVVIISSAYTYYLWGRPYAIIIFTLEAIWFSTIWTTGRKNTVLIDVGYWLVIGTPLVFLFYIKFIGLSFDEAGLIALKQTLNGVFNALVANYILWATHVFWKKQERISIRSLLFNIILTITLLAGTIPAIIGTNQTGKNYEQQVDKEINAITLTVINKLKAANESEIASLLNGGLSFSGDIAISVKDVNGKTIFQHGETMSDKEKPESILVTRNNDVKIWLPGSPSAVMKQWRAGRYIKQIYIKDNPNFSEVVVEKGTKNVVNAINHLKAELFLMLAILMCTAIVLAYFLSRWLTIPADNLDKASHELINSITSGKLIELPKSRIQEFYSLSSSLSLLASSAISHYKELHSEKELLEGVVDKNTDILKRLSVVASRTTNSVVITDVKGNIEWVNNAFVNLTGHSFEYAIGKRPGDILQGSETSLETVNAISKQLKSLRGFSEDIINYTKDGKPYWVHVDCDPIEENGNVVGFIAIESDITQRKNTENDLIKRTSELNAVLDAATEIAIITTSADGIITMFNAGAEKMLGYTADEMVNKQSPALLHLPSEVELRGLELSKIFKSNIEGFQVFITIPEKEGSETREWTYIKKDGSHIIVQLSVTFMQSDDGEIIGYLGVAQDITGRKKLEKLKNEFVSTVSHELRTPLTSIHGALKLISGGVAGEVPEKVKELIGMAEGNAQRLNRLINDLLDMDKIASGKLIFHFKTQLLMPIIEQSLVSNQSYANQYNVSLNIKQRIDGIKVNVDSDRLSQVLSNFISNAAKFSRSGDVVDILVSREDETIRVSVQDYGIGIDEAFHDHIFVKFSQEDTSAARSKGGTGLGLAISRELIASMDGKVGFESEKNKGSIFWLELPIVSIDS